ncbi:SPOR domain-containing protein [Dongshaea marina]|uniref:SPOR domain-containing protein n=1 Tax=Dongshaea marina TaxID=2047966 RepID=UPI000D3EE060|nr:SPOR domain-containing protein [Dongshaea marina]
MATKDYVRRGKTSSKKKKGASRRPTKKRNAPQRRIPVIAILIAVILVGAFGYGLFWLGQHKSSTPQTSELKPQAKPPKKELPKPPAEHWSIARQLENKEVQVVVPEQPKPPHPYQMQCGSFRVEKQAETLKARIAFQGLSSQILKSKSSKGGYWYRVVLGPYPRKREAQNDQHKLQRAKIFGCAIWYWQG